MTAAAALRDSTVRVGPLFNVPALLLKLGCDPDHVFERAGYNIDELKDTDHRISYLATSRLLAECVTATRCEHFGLLLGQMAGPSYLGVAGFLVRSAATVGQALEALVKNLDLHDEGGVSALNIEKDYTRLSFHVHQPGVSAIGQIYDLSVAIMYKTMCSLCGNDWKAAQICLVRRKPADTAPYKQYFRAPLVFDSEICGILFSSHYLERTPPAADELLHHHLELEAEALHQVQQHEIVDLLPAILQKGLLMDQSSAGDIADAIGIHERTLHRRLQSAGTTFRQQLDLVRESLSLQLLQSSSLPICDIATSLGYADSSGFIRAFHRWTGNSPASWRKQNGFALN